MLKLAIAVLLGVSAALGGAALAQHPRVVPTVDVAAAQAIAAGDLRAQWAALHTRASTLAQLPRLGAAIATDAATVADLTTDELAFRVRAGETIALAQRAGDGLHLLLTLPPGGPQLPLDVGTTLGAAGGELVFRETVPVVGPAATGTLAIAWRAQASTVFSQLAALTPARLVIAGAEVAIGTPLVAGAPTVTAALSDGATLALPAALHPSPARLWLTLGGLAAAAGALALVIVALVRRPRAAPVIEPGDDATPRARAITLAAGSAEDMSSAGSTVRLGRYERIALLAIGGTSSVYLARLLGEEGFEKRVALKVLRPELARDERFRELFLDEARLASQLAHPNVVQILDLGVAGDELFIAMEHVDGEDLEQLMLAQRATTTRTPLPIALTILRRLCDGLHSAHTAVDRHGAPLGLVHRDVKPGNVLLSRNGEIKIGDFGIAKASQQVHRSADGETKGTLAYMAPEQRMGLAVDARTDVFGVAAIGYELITGNELDMDLKRLLAQGLDGWPHLLPIDHLRPEAPAELQDILFTALAYDPARRPATCEVLEHQLAEVMRTRGWTVGRNELAAWLRLELDRNPNGTATLIGTPSYDGPRV